jgi:Ca2+-binding EF-hand superfamily protein
MKIKTIVFVALTSFGVALNLYAEKGEKGCREHDMDKHHPRFEMLDTDKDGKVSKEEWMAHFNEMDANKDGFIDEEEMKKHHEAMKDKTHEHMHEKMEKKK